MSEPNDYPGRPGPSVLSILIAILLASILVAMVAGILIFRDAAKAVTEPVERVRSGVAELVKEATPTIRPNPATIIHEIQALSRLETVSYSVEKVVTAEKNQQGLTDLLGLDEKLLFVAHGQVIAGIDLMKLQVEDITITDDNTIIVALPASEIFVATLDNEKSYVYDHERGLLNRVFEEQSELETLARQAAEDEIERAAIEDGILNTADVNAQNYMRAFLMALGFDRVVFEDVVPVPATPEPTATPLPSGG